MKNFVLIGAAGYIAPRHMRAIRDTGHNLVAALDKNDSVGAIDSYFPNAAFFTEFERFERYLDKIMRDGTKIDYVSVCSPNYFHDAHIRFGLRIGADVICEKPLVLNPWNLESLVTIEQETGKKVYSILQLRLLESLLELKRKVSQNPGKVYDVDLTYITSRGKWYYTSWKGSMEKSGGIATNIGIHFFDMLNWIFGPVLHSEVHLHTHDRAAGYLELAHARVKWFLSINYDTIPDVIKDTGARTYRHITVNGEEMEFSNGFLDLHTHSYESILAGEGFGLADSYDAIQIAYKIRNAKPVGVGSNSHQLALLPLAPHPFQMEEMAEEMRLFNYE